jgi:hypothetical protein
MKTTNFYVLKFSKNITEKEPSNLDVLTAMIMKNAVVWYLCISVTEGPDTYIIRIDDDQGCRTLWNVDTELPDDRDSDLIKEYLSSRQMMMMMKMMEAAVPPIMSVLVLRVT